VRSSAMEVIVFLLFLGVFYYLGRRLWDRRDGMQPQAASGHATSTMSAHPEGTSFGSPRSADDSSSAAA